jgi:hypothetical protein
MGDREGSALGQGLTYFAGMMIIIAGAFDIFQGLAALIKQNYFVVGSNYVYKFNVSTWGWINLILGALILFAGVALMRGALWGRIVGVVFAALVALANFLWLPYYPIWSIVIIALCVLAIWAIMAHGREVA